MNNFGFTIHINDRICVCIHIFIYLCMYTYVYVCMRVRVRMHFCILFLLFEYSDDCVLLVYKHPISTLRLSGRYRRDR